MRDGGRAVELAQSVVDEHPALNHLETLAMALAEAGRFDDAVTWQQRALEAERQAAGGNSPQRLDRLALLPGPPAVAGALTASGAGLAAGASFWPPLAAAGQKTPRTQQTGSGSGARRAVGHALRDRAVDLLRSHQDAHRHLDAAAGVQGH